MTTSTGADGADDQSTATTGVDSAEDTCQAAIADVATGSLSFSKELDPTRHREHFRESYGPSPVMFAKESKFEVVTATGHSFPSQHPKLPSKFVLTFRTFIFTLGF